MNSDPPGSTLLEALYGLESTAYILHRAAQHKYESQLERLQHVVGALGLTTTARPPRGSDEYLRDWQRYLENPQQRLTTRALRSLCWEPDIATDSRFQAYLDQNVGDLSTRMLQGLVRSCHLRWSLAFAAGAVAHCMTRRLEAYRGSHLMLARWREHAEMLLGPQGHRIFANSLLAARISIKKHCEEWALEESSQYVLEAVCHAVHVCQEKLGREEAWSTCLLTTLLSWEKWPVQDYRMVVGSTILHPITAGDRALQEALTNLVLHNIHLGDPRLPRNIKNWLGILEARQRFLQWLSRVDITFFFEHVLPHGTDPHGRKIFWLQYVSHVLRSRPLLNRNDERRLRRTMQTSQEQMEHWGRIYGETSAFLLDFGPLIVVEFSQRDNACYLYEKPNSNKVIADFLAPAGFTVAQLKRRDLAIRVSHTSGWQTSLANLLARYGIRSA